MSTPLPQADARIPRHIQGAKRGIVAWLLTVLERHRVAVMGGARNQVLVKNSDVQTKAQTWLARNGYGHYAPDTLARRFREVRETGRTAKYADPQGRSLAEQSGLSITQHASSPQAVWKVSPITSQTPAATAPQRTPYQQPHRAPQEPAGRPIPQETLFGPAPSF